MRISRSFLFAIVCASAFILTGCQAPKQVVNSYKYLLKDGQPQEVLAGNVEGKEKQVRDDKTRGRSGDVKVAGKLRLVLREADSYVGTPYRYGGIDRKGIDCSGLTQNCYNQAGVPLGRSAAAQSKEGQKVSRKNLQEGDLVFFDAKSRGKVDHVGMVTKVDKSDVTFIHATSSKGVRYDALNQGYWKGRFVVARRVAK